MLFSGNQESTFELVNWLTPQLESSNWHCNYSLLYFWNSFVAVVANNNTVDSRGRRNFNVDDGNQRIPSLF